MKNKKDAPKFKSDAKLDGVKKVRRGSNQKAILEKNMKRRFEQFNSAYRKLSKEEYTAKLQAEREALKAKLNTIVDEHTGETETLREYQESWIEFVKDRRHDLSAANTYLTQLKRQIYGLQISINQLYKKKASISKRVAEVDTGKYYMMTDNQKIEHDKDKFYSSEIPKMSKRSKKPNLAYLLMTKFAAMNRIYAEAYAIYSEYKTDRAKSIALKAYDYCDETYYDINELL